MNVAVDSALAYYARHGAALFPIPAGQKNPTGIVGSFAKDYSASPEQWERWHTEHDCNFGIVAGPSRFIIVDIDTKAGRDEAWAAWCDLCAQWQIPVVMPQVATQSGGWHVYFTVPDDVDSSALKQPDAIKKIINVRAGNGFTVCAGSTYESRPYSLLSDTPPYPAPAALVEHCTRAHSKQSTPTVSNLDLGDLAKVVKWLTERDAFAEYSDWVSIGMALKIEAGDEGFDIWSITHDDTVNDDLAASKWDSFADNPEPGCVTVQSWLQRAHQLGWTGTVRKSTKSMFEGVAAIAAAAGATLASAPTIVPGVPMMAGQEAVARLGGPDLDAFLSSTRSLPTRPQGLDYPTLPEGCSGHGLYEPMRDTINRVFAMAEAKQFKAVAVINALSVLSLMHAETFSTVSSRLEAMGCTVLHAAIKHRANRMSENVQRETTERNDWVRDPRTGEPQGDNSDNVRYMLRYLECELRWNNWLERGEIRGGKDIGTVAIEWPNWTYIDDTVVAKLRTRSNRTHTRFRPGKDFTWDTLLAFCHESPHDPVLDEINALVWDGVPRLSAWLQRACGVIDDAYHRAVSRNIIGGIVARVRKPGIKFDTMAVLHGPQGTGKSTLTRLLALDETYFSDEIELGDASKELVLSLAGKMVVEIGEMGMRSSTNANHVKAMISRQVDRGRTAYARAVSERPRRNIFIGTTNDDQPLQDPTGNRRFLPVACMKAVDLEWLRANIHQLYAEAAHFEAAGEDFTIPREVWELASRYQESARAESDAEVMLQQWFGASTYTEIAYVMAFDLANLAKIVGFKDLQSTSQRSALLKSLGFRNMPVTLNGKRDKAWVRAPETMGAAEVLRIGTRYHIGPDANGLPRVTIHKSNIPVCPV